MFNRFAGYLPILLLTAGHGAVDSYLGLLQVLAPGLASYLNIPLGDVVMLVGLGALLNNLSQPVAGWLMGRQNLAWTLWFSIILSSLPCFMGYANGLFSLTVIVFLGALGTGLYHPEAVLSAHDAAGEKAYLGIPLFMAGGATIFAVMTPVSIRLTEDYGFPALAWLFFPGLALAAIFLAQYRKRKRVHPSIVIRPRSKRMTRVEDGSLSFWPLLTVGVFCCIGSGLFLSVFSSHYELIFGPGARHWSGWGLMVMGIGGSLSSFGWSWLSQRYGFYKLVLVSQLLALPLFVLMATPSSPEMGVLLTIPLSLVAPAAIHPVGVTLSRNAAGSTQGMRTTLMVGGTYAVASVVIMAAGALLRQGVPSRFIILFVAWCSFAALTVALWQLLRGRKPKIARAG